MTTLTTSTDVGGILPPEFSSLITKPLERLSLPFDGRVATTITTGSTDTHLPVISNDGSAAWTAEGEEINPDDTTFAEVIVTPAKVAGLRIISTELANDSSPAAQQLVGDSLARALVEQIDAAFAGDLASPAPKGLASLTNVSTVAADLANLQNLDAFSEAISKAQTAGGNLTAFVMSPTDALALRTLKEGTSSNRPIVEPNVTTGTPNLSVAGVPVIVNSHIATGTAWGIDSSVVFTVLRDDVRIAISDQAFFSSDRIGVRATLRVGFGFTDESRLVKLTVAGS